MFINNVFNYCIYFVLLGVWYNFVYNFFYYIVMLYLLLWCLYLLIYIVFNEFEFVFLGNIFLFW